MRISKYKILTIAGIAILVTFIVLIFPVAFNNQKIYGIVLSSSIAIVVLLLFYLVYINIADIQEKDNDTNSKQIN